MYVERLKPYNYRLPCGLIFYTDSPSVGDVDGEHHFPCRRCAVWHKFTTVQLSSLQKTAASARDMYVVNKLDEAILKDRIVKDLRYAWDSKEYEQIADRHGVNVRTIYRILEDMGRGVSEGVSTDGSV